MIDDISYLDNNGTTFMYGSTKDAITKCMDQGNPSGNYQLADKSREIIGMLKAKTLDVCLADPMLRREQYKCVITSGASESNCMAIHAFSCIKSAHIITTAIEHKSIISCVRSIQNQGTAVTLIQPNNNGQVAWKDIIPHIRANTVLISVMHANNETGIFNDVQGIGRGIAKYNRKHRKGIVFHCDASQTFGKYELMMDRDYIDIISLSYHKLHGPQGIGAVLFNCEVQPQIEEFPLISGQQQHRMRGGTENVSLIAGALDALTVTQINRPIKNERLYKLKIYLLQQLYHKRIVMVQFKRVNTLVQSIQHIVDETSSRIVVVNYSPIDNSMCNTLFLFFGQIRDINEGQQIDKKYIISTKHKKYVDGVCGTRMQDWLAAHNVITSNGSACNAGKEGSDTLINMGIHQQLTTGVIRVSMSDMTMRRDLDIFVEKVCEYLSQI